MRLLRTYGHLLRSVCFVLVLAVLNISVDPPDLLRNLDADVALEEDISVNEMESISELVMEQVLDIDNAVPESDESETETLLKKVDIFQPIQALALDVPALVQVERAPQLSVATAYVPQSHLSIVAPPPKA